MTADGAHQGVSAERALKTILGGDPAPGEDEQMDADTFRTWIKTADRQDSYGESSRLVARYLLEYLTAHPEDMRLPLDNAYDFGHMRLDHGDETPPFDQWLPYRTAEGVWDRAAAAIPELKAMSPDLTGFMVGWAFNAARRCLLGATASWQSCTTDSWRIGPVTPPATVPRDEVAMAVAAAGFMVAAEKVRPLYVLSDTFKTLIDLVEDPAVDQVALDAELRAVTRDIQAKAFGIAEIIRDRERLVADLKLEEDKLAQRRKVAQNLADRLKEYALQEMRVMGIERIDFGVHTLSIRSNPPAVQIVDESAIPAEFIIVETTYRVDKRAILAAVKKDGVVVEGATVTRSERLEIR